MKKQFTEKAYSLTTPSTIEDVPKPVNRMFHAIIEARANVDGKTEVEVFSEIVMHQAKLTLGKSEAQRMLKVYEREERAQEEAFNRKLAAVNALG